MQNTAVVLLACLIAPAAAIGADYQPLNVKPGQWQVTETYTVTGLPSGMSNRPQTITYKSCVTIKDLTTNPFSDPESKCTWKVLNSSGSDMEVKGTSCALGRNEGMKADVHLKLHAVDSEHVKGSGDWTANGEGMNFTGNATGNGKWLGATCTSQ
jgi:hypothetical protein